MTRWRVPASLITAHLQLQSYAKAVQLDVPRFTRAGRCWILSPRLVLTHQSQSALRPPQLLVRPRPPTYCRPSPHTPLSSLEVLPLPLLPHSIAPALPAAVWDVFGLSACMEVRSSGCFGLGVSAGVGLVACCCICWRCLLCLIVCRFWFAVADVGLWLLCVILH